MITLHRVCKHYGKKGNRRIVLSDVSAEFLAKSNYVVFGGRHAGKTTLLKILCGIMTPNRGLITRNGTVSIPAGYASIVAPGKTAFELAKFLSTLYDAPHKQVCRFVEEFTQYPTKLLEIPVGELPSQMRSLINYAITYAIPADFYLFDDFVTKPEPDVKEAGQRAFDARRKSHATIVTSRTVGGRVHGERGVVIHQGRLYFFDDVDDAADAFDYLERQKIYANLEDGPSFANALARSGDVDGALAHLDAFAAENPTHLAALEMIADLNLSARDNKAALAASKRMLAIDPDAVKPMVILGKLSQQEGRLQEAVLYFDKALTRDQFNKDCLVGIARCFDDLKLFGQAGQYWLRIADNQPEIIYLRFAIRSFVRDDDWTSVLSSVELAIPRLPSRDKNLVELKLRALLELKRMPEARAFIGECQQAEAEVLIRQLGRLARTDDWVLMDDLLSAVPGYVEGHHDHSEALVATLNFLKQKKRVSTISGQRV